MFYEDIGKAIKNVIKANSEKSKIKMRSIPNLCMFHESFYILNRIGQAYVRNPFYHQLFGLLTTMYKEQTRAQLNK